MAPASGVGGGGANGTSLPSPAQFPAEETLERRDGLGSTISDLRAELAILQKNGSCQWGGGG